MAGAFAGNVGIGVTEIVTEAGDVVLEQATEVEGVARSEVAIAHVLL